MVDEESERTPFALAVSEAIRQADVSLSWLSSRLREQGTPVAASTLSYWRSGERMPEGATSLAAVDGLEALLGLLPGELSDLVVAPHRRGGLGPVGTAFDAVFERDMNEVLLQLEAPAPDGFREISSAVTVTVGDAGTVERVRTKSLIQVVERPAAEIALVMGTDDPDRPLPIVPEIVDVRGATVTRSFLHPHRTVGATILALNATYSPGQTFLLELTQLAPEGYGADDGYVHGVPRRAREILIQVVFSASNLPTWCEEVADGTETRSLSLHGNTVHAFRHDFGPGRFGVRWGHD